MTCIGLTDPSKGLSFSPENPPTKMQMLKLAMNPTFRESAKRVMDELKKEGIEINPEVSYYPLRQSGIHIYLH